MKNREFCKKCRKCRERTVVLASVPYVTQFEHDGRKYTVSIPDLVLPRCANCGTMSFDSEADDQICREFRKLAGLLQPEEIRSSRLALNLTQQALADLIG